MGAKAYIKHGPTKLHGSNCCDFVLLRRMYGRNLQHTKVKSAAFLILQDNFSNQVAIFMDQALEFVMQFFELLT